MLHIRVVTAPGRTGLLLDRLRGLPGIRNLVVLEGAARDPHGDAVFFDVDYGAANPVFRALRGLGTSGGGMGPRYQGKQHLAAGQTGTSAWPGPLRHFADRLDELRSADVVDMHQVGRVLVDLAADEEFFVPLIAQIPVGSAGSRWLIRPERGPRLVLVHRPEGVMGYTHSHRCWVGIAPVRGVETHQRWDVAGRAGGVADLRLADERALVQGDVATLVPPRDVHNHGHVVGSGPSPYSLILLGDDMLLFDREEYDPEAGTWRALAPGDPGRDNR